jgi:hypothetical protein
MVRSLNLGVRVDDLGDQSDAHTVYIAERTQVSDATAGLLGAGLGAKDGTPGRKGGPAGRWIVGARASTDQRGASRSDRPGDDGQGREGGQESSEELDRAALPGSLFGVSDRDSHEGPLINWETNGRRSLT